MEETRMVWTITSAAQAIRAGRLTPIELLEAGLEQIDRHERKVRAWVMVDREGALAEATKAAAEIRAGHYRGELHGIPLGIKDIIDVADWPTTAGFKPWAASIARRNATVIDRLLACGAILLGKTVTTQFASFDPPPTRNPWNITRTPGGSSSGSAAAVACGMCLASLGSQTGGSITRPASYCGVASCKPTFGRVSTDGIVPLAHSMDHVGVMASCVRDLAIALQTIAGADPRDPECSDRPVPDLVGRGDQRIEPPSLGRLRGLFDELATPPIRAMMDQVTQSFKAAKAVICDVPLAPDFARVIRSHRIVMAVEAAKFHAERLRRFPNEYGPKIRELLEEGLGCPVAEYEQCKTYQVSLREVLQSHYFGESEALLTPATTSPAPDAATTGDPAFNSPWSYTGFPTVSIPAGRSEDGLPIAIQLVGRSWDEERLFAVAAWCEKVLDIESSYASS
jgi:aspartyl-tRNA(Asn)/glutamyl-tRNA(Gln) amidotransferase subunit A